MKVLIIGLYNKLGGIEKCIYDYVSHMDLTGVSVGFLGAPEHIWFEDEFKKLGCVIHPVCGRRNVLRYYKELCRIIRENHYDIVHINMLSCANCIPVIAALNCGVKVICHSHNSAIPRGSFSSLVKKVLHGLNRSFIRNSDVLKLACSKEAGHFFYGNKPFSVLTNAIDTLHFSFDENVRNIKREVLGIPKTAFVIGQVGRFEYQKNHVFSIQFFSEFLKTHPDSFLLFVGTGSLEDVCKKKVKELGIEKNVLFCGQQNDIAPFLFAMDIFLFPSVFEGLGIVGIEAQCAGLPVIASKNVAAEMEQSDLVNWCDLTSPISEWITAIENSLQKQSARQEYAKRIKERGFDISELAGNLMNIYKSCMEKTK